MKTLKSHLKVFPLFLILITFYVNNETHADTFFYDTHRVDRCAKIINLEEFPEITLIGFVQGPMVKQYESYKITKDLCLHKGYKFNILDIYTTKNSKFTELDLNDLEIITEKRTSGGSHQTDSGEWVKSTYDYFRPKNFQLLFPNLESYGGYADDRTAPQTKEIVEYQLEKDSNENLFLYKAKKILEHDSKKLKTEHYSIPISKEIIHFPDTLSNSLEGTSAAYLRSKNIIGGFPDGEFKGSRPVNRAELAKFLLLAKGIQVDDLKNNKQFSDVLDGEWYVKYVMKAAEMDIINGYPSGNFKPAQTVNTAEFLKMIAHTFELYTGSDTGYRYKDVQKDDWFHKYAPIAQGYKLFPSQAPNYEYLNPEKELTRNEIAIALTKLLKYIK